MSAVPATLWRHVDRTDTCWIWTGCTSVDGYGRTDTYKSHGTSLPHRVTWMAENGPVPDGLELDHLCNNRSCVRPDHLEAVTHAENIRRAANRRSSCRNGHPIALQVSDYAGGRRCLLCRRAANAAYMRRRRQAARVEMAVA